MVNNKLFGRDLTTYRRSINKIANNCKSLNRFVNGQLNACYNALDRHIAAGRGSKVAIIHDSPLTRVIRKLTYQELHDTVSTS